MSSIQITIHTQTTLRTIMLTLCQCLLNSYSAITTSLTCAIGVDSDHMRTSFFRFVRKYFDEHSPSSVMNAFRKAHLSQTFNIKVFVCNKIIFANQFSGFFVQEVLTLICDFSMQGRQLSFCCFTFVLGVFRLNFFQIILRLTIVSRIINYCTIRKNRERIKPQIDTDSVTYRILRNDKLIFNHQRAIPMITGPVNGAGLYFAAVHHPSMLPESNKTDLDKFQPATFDFESRLWVSDGIVSVFSFKTRESWCLSLLNSAKKILKAFVESPQNILQHLRVNLHECWYLLLDGREFICLLCESQFDLCRWLHNTALEFEALRKYTSKTF